MRRVLAGVALLATLAVALPAHAGGRHGHHHGGIGPWGALGIFGTGVAIGVLTQPRVIYAPPPVVVYESRPAIIVPPAGAPYYQSPVCYPHGCWNLTVHNQWVWVANPNYNPAPPPPPAQ